MIVVGDDANSWKEYAPGAAYRCCVFLRQSGDNVVATAAQLPHVEITAADGTIALDRIQGALQNALRGYKAASQQIPWVELPTTPAGATLKVLIVEL